MSVAAAWTASISYGEVVRRDVDQSLTISPCKLRYLYQGLVPDAEGPISMGCRIC